jgi:hypothetical protein
VTVASKPAKAASFLGLSNLEMSPISLRMAAPVTLPNLVMVVMGDSQFFHDARNFRFCYFYLFFDKRKLLNQCIELEYEAVF